MEQRIFACAFAAGQWRAADWQMVQSPRWDRANHWLQESDHIRSDGPETEAGGTYTSMIRRAMLTGDFIVHATMSFDARMAPLLVVGQPPAPLPDSKWAYGEHHELVLFDEGINLWHHTFAEGTPAWTLAAKWRFVVQAQRRYRLSLAWRAGTFGIFLDGSHIGDHPAPGLKPPCVAGLTACEGTNRFYDFAIDSI
ncbi:MAG: hypothetical protein O2782_20510 [bacterium]|nr:hypothetical protein [bacterium]